MITLRTRVTREPVSRVSTAIDALAAVEACPDLRAYDDHGVSSRAPYGVWLDRDELRARAAREQEILRALDAGLSGETALRLGERVYHIVWDRIRSNPSREARMIAALEALEDAYRVV